MLAVERHLRFIQQGEQEKFSYMLLMDVAWCLTFAILTPPLFYLGRRYAITTENAGRRITAYVLGSIPFLVAFACIRWLLLPPWNPLTQQFEPRSFHSLIEITYRFATQVSTYFAITVAAQAYEYFERGHKHEVERLELQQALAASELQVLKSQLHPHFLFNTLNGISSLIELDSRRAKAMVLKLATLLRATLQYQTVELIPLENEIKFAESYLELEKMRLGQRLEVRWDIEPGTAHLLVPELILQPLIENAVMHGVSVSREGGWVQISAHPSEQMLELRVVNTVKGVRPGGSGIGLRNTRARLRYLYSGEAKFSFQKSEDGKLATAILRVPLLGSKLNLPEDHVSEALK